jgi:hypothetical protein
MVAEQSHHERPDDTPGDLEGVSRPRRPRVRTYVGKNSVEKAEVTHAEPSPKKIAAHSTGSIGTKVSYPSKNVAAERSHSSFRRYLGPRSAIEPALVAAASMGAPSLLIDPPGLCPPRSLHDQRPGGRRR